MRVHTRASLPGRASCNTGHSLRQSEALARDAIVVSVFGIRPRPPDGEHLASSHGNSANIRIHGARVGRSPFGVCGVTAGVSLSDATRAFARVLAVSDSVPAHAAVARIRRGLREHPERRDGGGAARWVRRRLARRGGPENGCTGCDRVRLGGRRRGCVGKRAAGPGGRVPPGSDQRGNEGEVRRSPVRAGLRRRLHAKSACQPMATGFWSRPVRSTTR